MPEEKDVCFVIMPFSKTTKKHNEEYWTQHFEDILKPLIEENSNLRAKRSEALRGDILRQIITDLVVSKIVVADLTDHNPNVFWELGVRQSFKHGTVTIAEQNTKLPFDIGAKGTLFYEIGNHVKWEKFRKKFKNSLQDCLKNPNVPDSHVLEILSGRGSLFEIFQKDQSIRQLDSLLEECVTNTFLLRSVEERAQANQKNPEKRKFSTGRFFIATIQWLIITRYINERIEFYRKARIVYSALNSLNDQLNLWQSSPDAVERWIIKNFKRHEKRFMDFSIATEEAQQRLLSQY